MYLNLIGAGLWESESLIFNLQVAFSGDCSHVVGQRSRKVDMLEDVVNIEVRAQMEPESEGQAARQPSAAPNQASLIIFGALSSDLCSNHEPTSDYDCT